MPNTVSHRTVLLYEEFLYACKLWIFLANNSGFESMVHNIYNAKFPNGKPGTSMTHALRKAKALIIRKELIKKARAPIVQRKNVEKSYRSRLVICIELLCTLASKGSMTLTQLTHNVEVDKTRLIPHLKMLHNRGLIEKQNLGEHKIFYTVTERGLKVLKVVSPLIKEAHKIQIRNLEVISTTLSGAGYL